MSSSTVVPILTRGMVLLGAVAAMSALCLTPAQAATKAFTKTHSSCKDNDNDGYPDQPCAALVYANGGAYQVKETLVDVRDNPYDTNPLCDGVDMSSGNLLRVGEYGVYIVPAPCRYKLTIVIDGGDHKGNHVYITPGCELVLESKGTSLNNNKPHKKTIKWTDDAKTQLKGKGITVSNDDVSDVYWHQAQGQSDKHACKMD